VTLANLVKMESLVPQVKMENPVLREKRAILVKQVLKVLKVQKVIKVTLANLDRRDPKVLTAL
jgi:hypothetical protein